MESILIAVVGTLNVVCFFVGAKVGQTVSKGEAIQTPTINPVKYIREREERRAYQEEQSRINTILENIDSYDGTGLGQKDVPR